MSLNRIISCSWKFPYYKQFNWFILHVYFSLDTQVRGGYEGQPNHFSFCCEFPRRPRPKCVIIPNIILWDSMSSVCSIILYYWCFTRHSDKLPWEIKIIEFCSVLIKISCWLLIILALFQHRNVCLNVYSLRLHRQCPSCCLISIKLITNLKTININLINVIP